MLRTKLVQSWLGCDVTQPLYYVNISCSRVSNRQYFHVLNHPEKVLTSAPVTFESLKLCKHDSLRYFLSLIFTKTENKRMQYSVVTGTIYKGYHLCLFAQMFVRVTSNTPSFWILYNIFKYTKQGRCIMSAFEGSSEGRQLHEYLFK